MESYEVCVEQFPVVSNAIQRFFRHWRAWRTVEGRLWIRWASVQSEPRELAAGAQTRGMDCGKHSFISIE